jgi:hypothetical protein
MMGTGKKLSSREGGLDLTSLASLLEAAARYSLEVMEKGKEEGENLTNIYINAYNYKSVRLIINKRC